MERKDMSSVWAGLQSTPKAFNRREAEKAPEVAEKDLHSLATFAGFLGVLRG
jgi:hypothetical protein